MKNSMSSAVLGCFLLLLLTVLPRGEAQEAPAPAFPKTPPLVELEDGDVFVFLGDSITHQALYTQFIETYFLTRYPDRDIRFHNAGVSGDRAADALRRFDRDVARYRPTHVSVLLGMNDAGYTAWKPEVFETYVADMTTLLDRLAETGASVSLMHPTMFDARAARLQGPAGEPTASRYNGALAYYGEWCREMAWQRGLGFADLHAPLNQITFEQRREDPLFTLIPDAVHPGPDGQVVMAVAMLDELFARGPLVSNLTILATEGGGHRIVAPRGELVEVGENEDNSLDFTYRAASLPWVLPEEARLGYRLTRAGHRHSGERFTVQSLPPGEWELFIDDQSVGRWPHHRLARGIELQENEKTPQYRQALQVAQANARRNAGPVKNLRDWWLQRKLREFEIIKAKAAGTVPGEAIARMEAEQAEWLQRSFEPAIERTEVEAETAWKALRKLAQPKPHRYELRRVAENP